MVAAAGLEPARPKAPDFKSGLSTNFSRRPRLPLPPKSTLTEHVSHAFRAYVGPFRARIGLSA